MKKLFLLILLLNNITYCQYKILHYDEKYCEICKCEGMGYVANCENGYINQLQDVRCKNCADWADSYRNSRGCDVCHNKKYIRKMVRIICPMCDGLGKIRNWKYTKEAKDIREAEDAKEAKRKEEELNNEKQIIENKRIEEAEHKDLQSKLNNRFDDNSKIVAINIDGQEPYKIKIFDGAIPNYNWAKTNTLNNTEWRLPTKTELVYLIKNNIINFQTQYGFWSGSIETDRSYSNNGKTVWVAEKKPDWGGKSNNENWTCGKDIFINANYCLKLVFINDENEDRTDNNVLNLKNPKYDVIVVKKIKTTHNSTQN